MRFAMVLTPILLLLIAPVRTSADETSLREAVEWIEEQPVHPAQCDYVMTAKLRLLVFWLTRDDVGGGYIRYCREATTNRLERIEVLFGSDPSKAPRKINRWGAGAEVLRFEPGGGPAAGSAFFGFMKTSKGQSASEMQQELAAEQAHGTHLFEAIVTRVDRDVATSRVVPFFAEEDYSFHDLDRARPIVLERFTATPGPLRQLTATQKNCPSVEGFLFTVQRLIDSTLAGTPPPIASCYVYNAHLYSATLRDSSRLPVFTASFRLRGQPRDTVTTYRNLLRSRFAILRQDNRARSSFEIIYATEGRLRGVPVQITYQPNWWFRVVLNLLSGS